MNIRIPHSWLLEHLDTTATPQEIQRLLSLSGPSVERIYEIEGEPVYDIEITTNRVDCMSVRGVAREAAVILSQAGIPSTLKKLQTTTSNEDAILPLPKIVNDPMLCKRIICQVVSNVTKTASPEWMQKRLRQVEINVHDSIIDTTNYITHDLGHPCHAFDYDKVMASGGVILVRVAPKGKEFQIIDGQTFTTIGGEVVFENEAGEIIDLPAIKGTKNTSIQDDTKNVLFWIETLDPAKVRFASMTHAIRTVAAQISEKNVDPHLAEDVFATGIQYLTTFGAGNIASKRFDEFSQKRELPSVMVPSARIAQYLGIDLPSDHIITILTQLGCKVTVQEGNFFITPPTFRPDIEIPEDVIEEIARMYGYHNLPSSLMTGSIPTQKTTDRYDLEHETKQLLATLGATEVYTYSMINAALVELESHFICSAFSHTECNIERTHIKLKNPLTDDMVCLRRTLWASHLNIFERHLQTQNLSLFEFANIYIPRQDEFLPIEERGKESDLPLEEFHFTLTTNGDKRYAKGMINAILHKFYLPEATYLITTSPYEATIKVGDTAIGTLISLPQSAYRHLSIFDINWKKLLQITRKYPEIRAESKFTPIVEDLTFTVPKGVHIQNIIDTIRSIEKLKDVKFSTMYKQNATFTLTYASDYQMTAEDALVIRKMVVSTLGATHQLTLVGELL